MCVCVCVDFLTCESFYSQIMYQRLFIFFRCFFPSIPYSRLHRHLFVAVSPWCCHCMCNMYLFFRFFRFVSFLFCERETRASMQSRQGSQICLWIEYVTTKYIIMLICARYPNKINRLGIDSRALAVYLLLLLLLPALPLPLYACTASVHFHVRTSFFVFINPCTRTHLASFIRSSLPATLARCLFHF